ncbi:DUF1345 domain-containing protein [Nostoc cycadae]|uniref:DUF1345 domain-containing protein n=1 Tax=Nostoc cycadae TaxID=246795 RepID=UPI001651703A
MFKNFDARPRLLISAGISVIISLLLPSWLHLATRILCVWNVGTGCFLSLTLAKMVKATPNKMQRYAQHEYEGRIGIFTLIIIAACVSVLAIGFLLSDKTGISSTVLMLHIILSVITIVSSWLLVHTLFALQYAHNYYHNVSNDNIYQKAGGLDFPDDRDPDYWDFLYFSFVIGMTSQVSDIQTTSRSMRRLALIHGVISFFFNTSILAMGINIIASLI